MKNKGLIIIGVVSIVVISVFIAVTGVIVFRLVNDKVQGGTSLVLQVSSADILKSLSDNNTNPQFNEALRRAEFSREADFVQAFYDEYRQMDGALALAMIFGTYSMKDKITPRSLDQEVLQVLREELNRTIDNTYNVLRTRMDRLGIKRPRIQKMEMDGRIGIVLPGLKKEEKREQVRRGLTWRGNLEFWETYTLGELMSRLSAIDEELRSEGMGLLEKMNLGNLYSGSPVVALVNKQDTCAVNAMLSSHIACRILPVDLVLRWSAKPVGDTQHFELIALKAIRGGDPIMDGSVIVKAEEDESERGFVVDIEMNRQGAMIWQKATRENIGRAIGIVLDGQAYSYPTVNEEIKRGVAQISGDFTHKEAEELANILSTGMLPAPVWILQEEQFD